MKLIDKDAVVAEINKLRKTSLEYGYTTMSKVLADTGKDLVLGQLLHNLDTLEVKEVDLTPTVYVVTRCEEHSDYVEKVFIDYNKAVDYCGQFEGNEDEYGRDITKIEVTEQADALIEELKKK